MTTFKEFFDKTALTNDELKALSKSIKITLKNEMIEDELYLFILRRSSQLFIMGLSLFLINFIVSFIIYFIIENPFLLKWIDASSIMINLFATFYSLLSVITHVKVTRHRVNVQNKLKKMFNVLEQGRKEKEIMLGMTEFTPYPIEWIDYKKNSRKQYIYNSIAIVMYIALTIRIFIHY